MKKYWSVFALSFQNEFTYRLNFVLWRFRNVLRILMTFFLWGSIFSTRNLAFGYSKEQMFAYIFLVLLMSSIVMSAPSNENIGSEIANGDLSNYLLKPVGYLRYWLTRDWASKLLNLLFAIGETSILWFIFRPNIVLSSSVVQILIGIVMVTVAALIFFMITKVAISVSFWNPEDTWSLMFVIMVLMETLAGTIFPLDVLPTKILSLLQFTPFPYLIYFPVATLVGRVDLVTSVRLAMQSLAWLGISYFFLSRLWARGLKSYSASGR
jgi:ABC-2 type transport system permease protein